MKIAIMQPYLFPYIGYWQLINAVDKFVILDDVNYIMRGYINRNSILMNGKPHRFTIPIKKASQNKLIMETKLDFDYNAKQKFLQTLRYAYHKAPYYNDVMPILESIILNQQDDLTQYIYRSFVKICEYLQLNAEFYFSSKIQKDNTLHGEGRIIEICKCMQGDIYINPYGGRNLYHHNNFEEESINLFFLEPHMDSIIYDQNNDNFERGLSIIDVLFYNDVKTINCFLGEYDLK